MKLKSFDEWVNEMSIAKPGDWDEGVDFLREISIPVLRKYEFITMFNFPKYDTKIEFELRKLRNSLEFVLGKIEKVSIETKNGEEVIERFIVYTKIQFTRYKNLEKKMNYNRIINVDGIYILDSLRGSHVALSLYKYLVNELHYNILGDENQYFGARKLWSRLSKELDVQVDLIDVETREIVEKNVILHHGNYDNDFDERLWNYKQDKKNVRSILTEIKD